MRITVNIPESINDIALGQYQKFYDIYDEKADKEFINRMALSVFYGIDGKYYSQMKLIDIEKIVSELNKALEQKIKLIRRFELNGIEYGIIPDFDDMTFGEFVDMDANYGLEKIHKLMSIIYRPIKNKTGTRYSIKPYGGTNDRLKDMPLGIALSALDFFFTIGLQLTSDTLKSLKPEDQQMKEHITSAKNGIGILQSTHWRAGILQSLIKS